MTSDFHTAAQLTVNALVVASQYALMAAGFILIYRITNILHFAHGIAFVLGPYVLFIFQGASAAMLWVLMILAVFLCGLYGAAIEWAIYRPLRKRDSSSTIYMVASLGVYIVCQNLLSVSFGDDTQVITISGFRRAIDLFGLRLTVGQAVGMGIATIAITVLSLLVKRTELGRCWRACSADLELARIVGIDIDRAMLLCFFVGSCLAGLAGICVCLDVDMNPTRGLQALIIAFIVCVLAGDVGMISVVGASCLLSFAQTFGGWFFGTQWQTTITFIILLAFLVFRREGIARALKPVGAV